MFNLGGMEVLVILVVALIVLGPEKLPRVMRGVGKAVGELRRASTEFQRTMNTELAISETKTPPENSAKKFPATAPDGGTPSAGATAGSPVSGVASAEPAATETPSSATPPRESTAPQRTRRVAPKPQSTARPKPRRLAPRPAKPSPGGDA